MKAAPRGPQGERDGTLLAGVSHLLDYLEERKAYLTRGGSRGWEAVRSLWPALHYASERDAEVRQRCAALAAPSSRWQHAYRSTLARNIMVLRETGKVLCVLEQQGINPIIVKGAALVESVYPDVGLRTMSDVDLFLPWEQIPEATSVLAGLGYALQDPPLGRLGAAGKVGLAAQEWQKDLAGGYFAVDLHWHLLGDGRLRAAFPRFSTEEMWHRTERVRIAGQRALTLGPEDALLYLCLQQLAWHPWSNPLGYLDLHLLGEMEKARIDWAIVASRAALWGLGRVVSWGCAWTQRLFGTEFGGVVLLPSHRSGFRAWLINGLARDDLLGIRAYAGQAERRDVLVFLLAEGQGSGSFLRSLLLPGRDGPGSPLLPSIFATLRYWCTLLLHAFRVVGALLPWRGPSGRG